jgi:hypothetical protein
MKRRTILILAVSIGAALALGLVTGLVLAKEALLAPAGDTVPTVISYQGEVLVDGEPYTGTGYFKFAVVNAFGNYSYWSNDGTSSGGYEPDDAVPLDVQDGLFSVLLGNLAETNMTEPIDADVFAARGRRLHVWFDEDGVGSFTDLGLTVISAVPYALNSETLDGLDGEAFQQKVDHVVVVAKSGGDHTTINAALDSIADNGPDSVYLVWVGPGVYSETVMMKPYVHIQGAGVGVTTISSMVSSSTSLTATATMVLTEHVSLRDITVVVTGTGKYKTAIVARNVATDTAEIVDVVVLADGGQHGYAIYNEFASPTIRDTYATGVGNDSTISGGCGVRNSYASPTIWNTTAVGIANCDPGNPCQGWGIYNTDSSPSIRDSVARGQGVNAGWGISNYNSAPTIRNTVAIGEGESGGEGIYNFKSSSIIEGTEARGPSMGIFVSDSPVTIRNSTAIGEHAVEGYGIRIVGSSPTIRNTYAYGGESGLSLYSPYAGSYTVTVDSCQLAGDAYAVDGDDAFTINVGVSLLQGPVVTDGATFHCVGAYDEAYTALDGTCQ